MYKNSQIQSRGSIPEEVVVLVWIWIVTYIYKYL